MTDYNAMSLDELLDLRQSYNLIERFTRSYPFVKVLDCRLAVRDAILDLAEQLDAGGLVVVPRVIHEEAKRVAAQWTNLRLSWDPLFNHLKAPELAIEAYVLHIDAYNSLPASPSSVEG